MNKIYTFCTVLMLVLFLRLEPAGKYSLKVFENERIDHIAYSSEDDFTLFSIGAKSLVKDAGYNINDESYFFQKSSNDNNFNTIAVFRHETEKNFYI